MDAYMYENEPWPATSRRASIIVPQVVQDQGSSSVSQDTTVSTGVTQEPARNQETDVKNDLYSLIKESQRSRSDPAYSTSVEYDLPGLNNMSQWAKVMQGLTSDEAILSSRFVELCRLRSIESELNEGDTLVFIDYPDIKRRHSEQTDCYGISYSSQKFRVHSKKLLATGSAKFAEMLNPTYQFRVQRRRKLTKNLPDGVKYVLDLTPPSEGDDLVFQMTQLSLTPGIIKWWAANDLHKVTSWLVTGHDDICTCGQRPIPGWGVPKEEKKGKMQVQHEFEEPTSHDSSNNNSYNDSGNDNTNVKIIPPSPHDLLSKMIHGINRPYETPSYRNIPDYCPIRHRNNIIRLLMMIEGHDVMLDSANRVWTLVGLAKIFDCPSVVRDPVTQWIIYNENTRFIEVLPEEALQIGFTLELAQVTQCAFRILVNELAIKEASTSSIRDLSRVTIFGRRLGDLDDELKNIVQHAARALVERVSLIPNAFTSEFSLDCWMIEEWVNLRKMEGVLAQETSASSVVALESLRVLMTGIQNSVKNSFERLTVGDENSQTSFISMDEDRASYVLPEDFELLQDIEQSMNLTQRLLCPFIYRQLGDIWNTSFNESQWLAETASGLSGPLMARARNAIEQVFYTSPSKASIPSWWVFLNPVGEPLTVKDPLVNLSALNRQIHAATLPYSSSWVRFDIEPPLNITRHMLLTLDNNEMKFLPLWAGGCNDGTGGVFEAELPPASWGPNGPGPAYHTGNTIASASSVSGSLANDFSTMKFRGSTVVGSLDAQDSISTVYGPGHVIADDVSIASESFDADGLENYYQEARYLVPADHQDTGRAVDMMVESLHSDADTASVVTDSAATVSNNDSSGDEGVMNIDDPVTQVIAQSDESDDNESNASTLEAWEDII
ncbi:uncharacterized protein TrAFT101_001086 [Trichoderma asperellum]|uniref:uncharacterized protein n=1 Tax=Trichoderma asperellum TaxID=101201 RepID=UPI0033242058|nr:hypothetical protein TrAFT101_001086 [Trichoderma asperellum]